MCDSHQLLPYDHSYRDSALEMSTLRRLSSLIPSLISVDGRTDVLYTRRLDLLPGHTKMALQLPFTED